MDEIPRNSPPSMPPTLPSMMPSPAMPYKGQVTPKTQSFNGQGFNGEPPQMPNENQNSWSQPPQPHLGSDGGSGGVGDYPNGGGRSKYNDGEYSNRRGSNSGNGGNDAFDGGSQGSRQLQNENPNGNSNGHTNMNPNGIANRPHLNGPPNDDEPPPELEMWVQRCYSLCGDEDSKSRMSAALHRIMTDALTAGR